MRAHSARFLVAIGLLCAAFGASASIFDPGFDELEQSLRLRPDQKEQFDSAVAATRRVLLALALNGLQMKQRIGEELEKPRPDLGAIARAQEDVVEQMAPLLREAREEWLRLYALLDERQVLLAKSFVREHFGRLLK